MKNIKKIAKQILAAITGKEAEIAFINYAKSKGYKYKVVGDYAYTKGIRDQSQMIKLLSAKNNKLQILETSKGRYEIEVKKAQQTDMPLMMRGKPNDENSQSQGMDENVQKMYDGKDRSHVTYDQLEIFDKEKGKGRKVCDWIDHETILNDLLDSKMSKKTAATDLTDSNYTEKGTNGQKSYPFSHEDALEYYYNNPKGKGDTIDEAIFSGIDKPAERIKQDFPLSFTNIEDMLPALKSQPEELLPVLKNKTKDYRRDETEKYLTTDQPLYNKRYWQEKTNPMQHSV